MMRRLSIHTLNDVQTTKPDLVATMVGVAIFFLPFTYALTVNVGFPLKVYEVVLGAVAVISLFRPKFVGTAAFFRILAGMGVLIVVAITGLVLNAISPTPEILEIESWRFGGTMGRMIEGGAKTIYLVFVVLSFIVIYMQTHRAPRMMVNAWLWGAMASATYLVYLNLSVNLGFDAIVLPGVLRYQQVVVAGITIIRSGTFEEGNFAALYFLFSIAIAIAYRRYLFAILFFVAMFLTMSTIGMVGAFVLLCLLTITPRSGNHSLRRAFAATLATVLFVSAFGSGYLGYVAEEKFSMERPGSFVDRLNDIVTGSSMFLENPMFGVGLAQYGYHFDEHMAWDDLVDTHEGKRIPNNVYVEMLAETGLVGAVCFLVILFLITRRLRRNEMVRPLLAANLSAIIVLNAFPTFTMMYLWAFWAVALALRDSQVRMGSVPGSGVNLDEDGGGHRHQDLR